MPLTRKRTTTTTTGTTRRRYIARASTRASRYAAASNSRYGFSIANPQQPVLGPRRNYQRPELKYMSYNFAPTFDGSGTISGCTVVNTVNQGVTSTDRIGNSISMKSLELVGTIWPGTAQVVTQAIRIIIVVDRQPDPAGVPTPISPYLLINGQPSGLTNISNSDRWTILYDKLFVVPEAAAVNNSKYGLPLHLYLPLKNVEVRYQIGGNFPTSNTLCIYTMGDTAAGVNTTPIAIAQARIRFIDT